METQNYESEKIFFIPGNIVTIKHDISNKPVMLVTEIVTNKIKSLNSFKGIKCLWFTKDMTLYESVFSTKDLIKL